MRRLIMGAAAVSLAVFIYRRYKRCPVNGKYCPDYKDCRNKSYCWLK